jgi:hypothetical protein
MSDEQRGRQNVFYLCNIYEVQIFNDQPAVIIQMLKLITGVINSAQVESPFYDSNQHIANLLFSNARHYYQNSSYRHKKSFMINFKR